MQERDFDNFDQHASNYRETHNSVIKSSGADSEYFSRYKVVEVLFHEKHNKIHSILDLGCGDGTTTRFLSDFFPKSRIFGIDPSVESISIAKKLSQSYTSIDYYIYDGKSMPFANSFFDIIFISMVLHHISPPTSAFLKGSQTHSEKRR